MSRDGRQTGHARRQIGRALSGIVGKGSRSGRHHCGYRMWSVDSEKVFCENVGALRIVGCWHEIFA